MSGFLVTRITHDHALRVERVKVAFLSHVPWHHVTASCLQRVEASDDTLASLSVVLIAAQVNLYYVFDVLSIAGRQLIKLNPEPRLRQMV